MRPDFLIWLDSNDKETDKSTKVYNHIYRAYNCKFVFWLLIQQRHNQKDIFNPFPILLVIKLEGNNKIKKNYL